MEQTQILPSITNKNIELIMDDLLINPINPMNTINNQSSINTLGPLMNSIIGAQEIIKEQPKTITELNKNGINIIPPNDKIYIYGFPLKKTLLYIFCAIIVIVIMYRLWLWTNLPDVNNDVKNKKKHNIQHNNLNNLQNNNVENNIDNK